MYIFFAAGALDTTSFSVPTIRHSDCELILSPQSTASRCSKCATYRKNLSNMSKDSWMRIYPLPLQQVIRTIGKKNLKNKILIRWKIQSYVFLIDLVKNCVPKQFRLKTKLMCSFADTSLAVISLLDWNICTMTAESWVNSWIGWRLG